jgi:hypothetical protein
MPIEEGVECPACKRAVTPRLWFTNERNPVAYRKAQHICLFCGVIMYETGGGVNRKAVILLLIVFGACALALLVTAISRS